MNHKDYKPVQARIHRFHDTVAVHIGGAQTQYISPFLAKKLAQALTECARNISNVPFPDSEFGAREFEG